MISLSRVLARGVLAIGAACVAVPAAAQNSYVTTEAEGWMFQPAVLTSSVPGHLAWPEAGTTTGSNMQVMWYRRESTGSWTSWGWTDNDIGAAALWVLGNLGDDAAFDRSHEIMAAIGSRTAADAVTPKQVVNGLFFDDTLQPEVQSSAHPEVLVSNLADLAGKRRRDCPLWRSASSNARVSNSRTLTCF